MTKIIGNTTATPNPRPDWNQTDPAKADYIKNKPNLQAGLKYYDDAGVTPSPVEWFEYEYDSSINRAYILGLSDTWTNLEDESKSNIVIPYEIEGFKVTDISGDAFLCNTTLKSVIIPNTIKDIGAVAFGGCSNLISLTIPDGTSHSMGSFDSCTSLTTVKLPNDITYIDSWAFNSCTALTSITIPDRVTTIYDHAFSNCTNLTSIVIPDSVVSCGIDVFYNCNSDLTIICSQGSYAETYAKENGYKYAYDTMTPSDYVNDLSIDDNIITVTKGDGSTSELNLPTGGSGGSIIVDEALDSRSTNPVQNKVVTNWITALNNDKAFILHKHNIADLEDYVVDEVLDETSTNPVQNKHIAFHISELMNADSELTLRIDNEIGSIEEKISKKLDSDKVDATLDILSTNPVQNKIVTGWIISLENDINKKASETHTHKISDLDDYVVDEVLDSSSINPVQNKVIYKALNDLNLNYKYKTVDMSTAVVPLDTNTVTYVYGEEAVDGYIGFDFDENGGITSAISEEIVLILDLTLLTENPSVMFPSIVKWFGGEPPTIESGKVYMFSFVRAKRADDLSNDFYLGIGGEFA